MAELKKIFVEAGHGGSDPGAVKYEKESELNIEVTNYTCEHLEANYECEVYKDITADSIRTVVARANKWGADLFISNHKNAGGGNGYEGLVYSEKTKELGMIFAKHVKAAGQNLRPSSIAAGVKYRPELGVLRLTDMPAILNEGAFVDNKKDIEDWNDAAELKKLGIAYAEAAAEYLGLPKKEKKPAKKEEKPAGTVKKVTAADKAKKSLKSLAGTYKATAAGGLNVRHGAGATKKIMVVIPKGTEVECYGFYTAASGVKWLYVQFTYKGVVYTGFCSKKYLKKV